MPFPVADTEPDRLAALRALEVLDTAPEPAYDDVVRLAATVCRAPIAMVNLVDADRQWSKAVVGVESAECPREDSLCARTLLAGDGVLVIPDTRSDARSASSALVLGPPHLASYAGAAITTQGGLALGALCVADRVPRPWDAESVEALRILARQVAGALELRRASREVVATAARLQRARTEDALTGLINRSELIARLDQSLREERRTHAGLGVLVGDLDAFKAINDDLGHAAGDQLLRVIADRLRDASRGADTIARVGGDEFAVICPGARGLSTLDIAAARLRCAVGAPVALAGTMVTPHLSFGAALVEDGDDTRTLLCRADGDMHDAKRGAPVLS